MKFSDKIKKLRKDNNLTQDELAEKLFVSRTAISKWETDCGYPSIESLKMITKLFNISFDDLMNDEDIKNQKLLDDKKAKKCYWFAMCGFVLAIIFTILVQILHNKLFIIGTIVGILIYLVFAYFTTPKYKRKEKAKNKLSYFLPKIFIILIPIIILLSVLFF